MGRVLANLFAREPFGRLVEIFGQIVKSAQVGASGTFGVVTARDLLARHFFVMGHRDLLVTRTYRSAIPTAAPSIPREASAVRLSSSGLSGQVPLSGAGPNPLLRKRRLSSGIQPALRCLHSEVSEEFRLRIHGSPIRLRSAYQPKGRSANSSKLG